MTFNCKNIKMKKSAIVLTVSLLASVGCWAQMSGDSWSKDYQLVEEKFKGAADVEALSQDAAFMASLKKVIAKGDKESAQLVADHSTFVFMNGMLNDVGASVERMEPAVRQSDAGKKAVDLFNSVHVVDVGSKVPDFTLPTPEGGTVNFYSFLKGKKCVLLDFWASWCVWCRKENPNVRAVYDAYKDKGFDVIGVSLDTKTEAWNKALAEDKPTWTQVLEQRGTKEGLYKWYNLNGIPAIFLISSDGHIIAKGLRGAGIEEAVKDFLGGNQ